jgi:hypothetical protein
MAKIGTDPKALQSALERLEDLRDKHIRQLANPKVSIGARPRLFVDIQEAIEKLEKLIKTQKSKSMVSTHGPKVFSNDS